ncbi:MAG TPA: methyltransferase domain-containing protein [Terracidiphilus sp.]|nr:methyltransferase domain-containing protein [Terracidiphilus sp.]
MEPDVLALLCDPDSRYPLEISDGTLRNTALGRVYPIRHGIPLFVSTVGGSNFKNQMFYDRIAPGYDLAKWVLERFGNRPDARMEVLGELEIKPGARVLEVGVGTGAFLQYLPADVEFFGVDLSWGMLRVCQRKLKRWGRRAHLFQGEAERLPFVGEAFDCVFHAGGLGQFVDQRRAIREMIWVARPGTKIVIADEAKARGNGPGNGADVSPLELVPPEMEDVKVRELAGGRMYCLTFRKPAE